MILVFLGEENLSLIFSNSSIINLFKAFLDFKILLYSIINFANLFISLSISPIPYAVSFCNLSSKIALTCSLVK